MEWFGAFHLGTAVAVAWAIVFVPHLVRSKAMAVRIVLVSLAYVGCYAAIPGRPETVDLLGRIDHVLSVYDALLLSCAIIMLHELIRLICRMPFSSLPAFSVLFLCLTVWAVRALHHIACLMSSSMWYRSIGGQSMGIHMAMAGLGIAVSVALWRAAARGGVRVVFLTALAAFTVVALCGMAFYWTLPELIIVSPALEIVGALTALSCVLAPIFCIVRNAISK